MGLALYHKKRNFKKTPEPPGKEEKSKSQLSFVVQRHKASRLHYDFRLEVDGVLKSWAVPKGPSLNPQDKRLAIMVEDHPYDYKNFEGIIPEGNYGAGIVEIWDKGTFSDIHNSEKKTAEKNIRAGIKDGSLKFRLYGKKLKGVFALVRMKGRGDNSWLLIKHNDLYAVHKNYSGEEDTLKNSPTNKWKRKIKKQNIKPMLAKETDKPFSNKDWIYEMKWDGYRAIAEVNDNNVSLYSRNGNNFNTSYPVVVNALKRLKIQAVLDGEIVVIDEQGKSNFQLLQYYGSYNEYPLEYRVFDVLNINGENTCDLPLIERKKLLRQLLVKGNETIKYSDYIEEKGIDFFEAARKKDLEGIMAKKADSLYYPGIRTSGWLKIKHHKTQEAVIAGFTKPAGSRKYLGALVLGIWDKGRLKYAGHTGSGFDMKDLKEINKLLQPLIKKESPFEETVKTNMPVTWVKPVLVCEIKYAGWTRNGRMRHPVFLRLRDDKKANEITMEAATIKKSTKYRVQSTKNQKKNPVENGNEIVTGKIKVKVSNLKKIFWPEENITKGDVIRYYQSIARYILPYLEGRPQSLKRNPNGIIDDGFFHKDAGDEAPVWVTSKAIYSESAKKNINYIICNDAPTLAYLNNLGCIEINPWHSTVQALDHPDYLIIDIDPSRENTFIQVIEAAHVIKDIFKKAGAESYCKTSGATGLHVYVPTQRKYTYDQLKDFAQLICILAQEQLPEFTSLERNLKKRSDKMIYLDHLQNRRGQTISSVYSLRPKKGAPVSMPLEWKEVKPGIRPGDFNIYNSLKRMEKKGDLFSPVLGKGIELAKCLKALDK